MHTPQRWRRIGATLVSALALIAAFRMAPQSIEESALVAAVAAQGSNVDGRQNNIDGNPLSQPLLMPQPDVVTGVGCSLPAWLEAESRALDDLVVKLHKRQGLEVAEYQKQSPVDCALQRFRYRVRVLSQVVAQMEK